MLASRARAHADARGVLASRVGGGPPTLRFVSGHERDGDGDAGERDPDRFLDVLDVGLRLGANGQDKRGGRGLYGLSAGTIRHTTPPPSSTTSSAPSAATVTAAGRPHTSRSDSTMPVMKSWYWPVGAPFFIITRTTL